MVKEKAMSKAFLAIAALCLIVVQLPAVQFAIPIDPKDNNSNKVHAHGGCVLKEGNTYYWFGEAPRFYPGPQNYGGFDGVNCYSSTDLQNWHFEGKVLSPRSTHPLSHDCCAYRPKVIYNSSTSKYVLILTEACNDYSGHLVFATSSTINGTYTYQGWGYGAGNSNPMDMTAFKDDDGSAYVIYSNSNSNIAIDRLSSDYLTVASRVTTIGSGCEEGPGMFKSGGRYFLITSYCSYWSPNQNGYRTSTSISSGWSSLRNGNIGNSDTYGSQNGQMFAVTGMSGTTWIYNGDRWSCSSNWCDGYANSKYVWLPLTVNGSSLTLNGGPDGYSWHLAIAAGTWSANPTSATADSKNSRSTRERFANSAPKAGKQAVFPSLAHGTISLAAPEDWRYWCDLIDATGRIRLSYAGKGNCVKSIAGLPESVYMLRISQAPGIPAELIILNR